MSLDYFLLCKKTIEKSILSIEEIIEDYYKMYPDITTQQYMCTFNENPNNIFLRQISQLERIKKEQEQLVEMYRFKIHDVCCHEFVEDYIDVDCERSIKIKYCLFCEITKS